jgi:hypothetical protein
MTVGFFGQTFLHHGIAEHIGCKKFRNLSHMDFPFRGRNRKSGNEAQRSLSATPLPFNAVTLHSFEQIVKARISKK